MPTHDHIPDNCPALSMSDNVSTTAARVETIEASVKRIERALLGNGTPGIIVRVDRLEQSRRQWKRLVIWAGSVFVVLVTSVITAGWEWIKSRLGIS